MVLAIRLAALWREQANRPAFWLSCLLFTTLMTTFSFFHLRYPGNDEVYDHLDAGYTYVQHRRLRTCCYVYTVNRCTCVEHEVLYIPNAEAPNYKYLVSISIVGDM